MFLANNSVEVVKTCHLLPIQWEPTVLGVKLDKVLHSSATTNLLLSRLTFDLTSTRDGS
jgi:hypothetical protein